MTNDLKQETDSLLSIMSSLTNGHSQSNFAKFAFNIYGTLSTTSSSTPQSHEISPSPSSSLSSSRSRRNKQSFRAATGHRLTYQCDKETISLSQLNYPLQVGGYGTELHSIVIGGKNYLRLLCISESQQRIIDDINLLESKSIYNSRVGSKLININTIKTYESTIATGLSNGVVSVYKISPNGQGKQTGRFSDHKRTINSLDFIESENQLLSGSQDGTIKLWDLRSSSSKPSITIQASMRSDPIRACQYSPHSSVKNKMCVLSVHDSGALCKFDLRSTGGNGNIYSPEKKWNLHTGPALSLHIHPEKEYVITGGRDQRISVFNYGEGQSNSSTPENTIITYGPVLKVRWSSYSNISQSGDEFEEAQSSLSPSKINPLYNYDIACLYLNDDPTVAIYNLSRKYVPKQIIHSKKPIQNFIWARNGHRDRNIWTLTKSNTFNSYNLDQIDEYDVSRPLDDLNNVAVAWDNNGNFSMANQDKYDFELDDNDIYDRPEGSSEAEVASHGMDPEESGNAIHFHNSATTSPVEKAALARSYTHNPMLAIQLPTKSPLPIGRNGTGFLGPDVLLPNISTRPKLTRNTSQTTQDSSVSYGSAYPIPQSANSNTTLHMKRNIISNSTKSSNTSAYVIPVVLPIVSNDEFVFKKLSSEYLVKLPDGFTMIDVCLLNASTAASVNSNRTCQVWRLLAVSLQEHFDSQKAPMTIEELEKQQMEQNENEEGVPNATVESATDSMPAKSVLSVLGNFVESYKTNSSFGTGSQINKPGKLVKLRTSSGVNLMDKINLASRTSSFSKTSFKFKEKEGVDEDGVPEDKEKQERGKAEDQETENDKKSIHSNQEPIVIRTTRHSKVEDLDDENLNIANSMAMKSSPTSVGISLPSSHTFSSSIASSPQPIRGQIPPKQQLATTRESPVHNWLDQKKNELFRGRNVVPAISGLSLALKSSNNGDEKLLTRAWKFKNLLRKSLDYAMLQGDVIFCSTAAILFYEFAEDTISEYEYLEWVSLYIDILQKKKLFVTAINILNSTAGSIKSKLQKIYSVDLDLRFYCSNCETLLVNEKSQMSQKGEFGYWYCDECNKLQLKCVYCNEPCKGLAVVVGLKCGHQGHFGCLKEWFIQDENMECPGGCDYQIL